MAFSVFKGRIRQQRPSDSDTPVVQINAQNNLRLNYAAWIGLREPTHVYLLWDADRRWVAIEHATPEDQYAVRVLPMAKSYLKHVSAAAFLKECGYERGPTRRFTARVDDDGRLLFSLDGSPLRVRRSERKAA